MKPFSPVKETTPNDGDCAVRLILDRIGDTWSFLILLELANSPLRFGQLRARIEDVSQRMLTATLRNLQRDGLIEREVFPTSPPSVEYRLSDIGRSVLGPMHALEEWASKTREVVQRAREAYDNSRAAEEA